jgi:hypothetical protein
VELAALKGFLHRVLKHPGDGLEELEDANVHGFFFPAPCAWRRGERVQKPPPP